MNGQVKAVTAYITGLTDSATKTWTPLRGPRAKAPQKRSGATDDRWIVVAPVTGHGSEIGAGATRQDEMADIEVAFLWPVTEAETDTEKDLGWSEWWVIWTGLCALSPKRKLTSSPDDFTVDSGYTYQAALMRPSWAPDRAFYALRVTLGVARRS